MRIAHLGSALALSLGILTGPAYAGSAITGDYLEARSCNVFIGGCHYGAEFVTTGREALMVWRVGGGSYDGVNLAGLSAAAVISADLNLAEPQAKRSTLLYVDASAQPAQREALVAFLKEKYGAAFGSLIDVRTAPIQFNKGARDYQVKIGGDARLIVQKQPDDSCCRQPMEVWYQPLGPVTGSSVGFTTVNEFKGRGLATTWTRANQNSAFFGGFSFEP